MCCGSYQLNHFLENMEVDLSDLNEINCANRNIGENHVRIFLCSLTSGSQSNYEDYEYRLHPYRFTNQKKLDFFDFFLQFLKNDVLNFFVSLKIKKLQPLTRAGIGENWHRCRNLIGNQGSESNFLQTYDFLQYFHWHS